MWGKFSHCIYNYNRGKIVASLKCRVACFCQRVNFIVRIYLTFLNHLNVNTPKDNPFCLSLGTTALYYWGLNFHNLYSYSLIYLRPGQKNRYTNVILQLTYCSFSFLFGQMYLYIQLYLLQKRTGYICHDYILQQDSTLHVY